MQVNRNFGGCGRVSSTVAEDSNNDGNTCHYNDIRNIMDVLLIYLNHTVVALVLLCCIRQKIFSQRGKLSDIQKFNSLQKTPG